VYFFANFIVEQNPVEVLFNSDVKVTLRTERNSAIFNYCGTHQFRNSI